MKVAHTSLTTLLVGVLAVWAGSAEAAPQASITLKNSAVAFCNIREWNWSLSKTNDQVETAGVVPDVDDGTEVTWTVKATKTEGESTICANGYMQVTNTGSADATIGNIVVNLQKPRSGGNTGPCKNVPWVSAAADVADATNGNAATTAHIVAAASSEVQACNSVQGPPNYTVTGTRGTFLETAGSGPLEFTDANSNTIWAITPQQTIAPGATVSLFFSAKFDNTQLGFADLQSLRTEVIVSFGNAGARGGGGATASDIDINGSGGVDGDEAHVRSVPTRVTESLPELFECNDEVTLEDTLSKTGTAGFENVTNPFPLTTSTGGDPVGTVIATVTAGAEGGTVTNTVRLAGQGQDLILTYNTGEKDPVTQEPIMAEYTFHCCEAVDLEATSSVNVNAPATGIAAGDYCTYTRNDYGKSWNPNPGPGQSPSALQTLLTNNFPPAASPAFPSPSYLTIGNAAAGNPPFFARWTSAGLNTTGQGATCTGLICYLSGQTGGSGALTADTVDATSTAGGNLTGQLATLTVNVGLGAAGKLPVKAGSTGNVGALQLCNLAAGVQINGSGWTLTAPQANALNGQTINQVLAALNTAVSDGTLLRPYSATNANLNDLATQLNQAFPGTDDLSSCALSAWAQSYICKP